MIEINEKNITYKVIRVINDIVSIASSDGNFFNVPVTELDFTPKTGDYVQCFRNGEKIIVLRELNSLETSCDILQKQRRGVDVPVQNILGDEKKSIFPIISIVCLILALVGGIAIYRLSKDNPMDLAREYGESAECYVKTQSASCKNEARAVLRKADDLSQRDKELFFKYIYDHGYADGPYGWLFHLN